MVTVRKIDIPESNAAKQKTRSISLSNVGKPWYATKPVITMLLVVFFPVGIPLMWKFTDWTKKTKGIVTGVILIITALGFLSTYRSTPTIILSNAKTSPISTDSAEYTLSGSVSSIKVATLAINTAPVTLSRDAKFSHRVLLEEGDNEFAVVARNDNGTSTKTVVVHRTTQAEFSARAEAARRGIEKKNEELPAKEQKNAPERTTAAASPKPASATPYPYDWDSEGSNMYLLLVREFDSSQTDFKERIKATLTDFKGHIPLTANTMVGLTTSAEVYKCETLSTKAGYTIDVYRNCLNAAGGKELYNTKIQSQNIALYTHSCSPNVCTNKYELVFYPDDPSSQHTQTVYWAVK